MSQLQDRPSDAGGSCLQKCIALAKRPVEWGGGIYAHDGVQARSEATPSQIPPMRALIKRPLARGGQN